MIRTELIESCEFNFEEFFSKDEKTYSGIVIYDFKDTESNKFISQFLIPFRRAYLSDRDLEFEVNNGISDRKEAIQNRLPTAPHLQSGEFAEILMYFIACHFIYPDANIRPIKWHWKENRDMACHLTDIVLLRCVDEHAPQENDYIFSMEVKAGATVIGPRSEKSRMEDAIAGAIKDRDSRLGKLIAYLTAQYTRDRNARLAQLVGRFKESVETNYQRYAGAAIVVEKHCLSYHINNITQDSKFKAQMRDIQLFAVPINSLKRLYESLYIRVPEEK